MYKRIFIPVIVFVGLFFVLYQQFKPQVNASYTETQTTLFKTDIKFDELSDYVKTHDGDYVLLLKDGSSSSEYLMNSILMPLTAEHETNPLPEIVGVNMQSSEETSVTRLKSYLKVESYPALVYIQVSDGKLAVKSTLKSSKDKPDTIDIVRSWFFKNGLWDAPYDAKRASTR